MNRLINIRMVVCGGRTSAWIDGKRTLHNQPMENYVYYPGCHIALGRVYWYPGETVVFRDFRIRQAGGKADDNGRAATEPVPEMNPYQATFSDLSSIVIAWIMVLTWLIVVTVLLHQWDLEQRHGRLSYCWPAGSAFLLLCGLFAVNFLLGIVGLAWLQIQTMFWMFWELAWMLSIVSIFYVLPFVVVGLLGWQLLDLWRHGANRFRIFIAWA